MKVGTGKYWLSASLLMTAFLTSCTGATPPQDVIDDWVNRGTPISSFNSAGSTICSIDKIEYGSPFKSSGGEMVPLGTTIYPVQVNATLHHQTGYWLPGPWVFKNYFYQDTFGHWQ
jgi:hypothetical protein